MKITQKPFGIVENKEITLFELTNSKGLTVKIMNYGAIVTSIQIPDKKNYIGEIVMGFDHLKQYLESNPYFGAVCGRYANRIAKGSFMVDGKEYKLAINNEPNALHGGLKAFDKRVWSVEKIIEHPDKVGVLLAYISKDMEEGYPGNLRVSVLYSINEDNEFTIHYNAETDKTTVLNLTNHSYFNLNGCKKNIYDHVLTIHAEKYTEVDETSIPTGKLLPVCNTPFDFRTAKKIGQDILKLENGYDHNYVLNKKENELELAAKIEDPDSRRVMEVFTTEPGVQFYSANFLDGTLKRTPGLNFEKQFSFCLETQHYPDSPNNPSFPDTILKPGDIYLQKTIYRFSVK